LKSRSVRLDIILRLGLLVFSSYAVFALLVSWVFSDSLKRDLDLLLESKAQIFVRSIQTYWDLQRRTTDAEANFVTTVQGWIVDTATGSDSLGTVINIFDADGNAIAFTKQDPGGLPTSVFKRFFREGRERRLFQTVEQTLGDGSSVVFRSVWQPYKVENRKNQLYVIQVGMPAYNAVRPLEKLAFAMMTILPLFLVALMFATWFLLNRTLMPLSRFVRTLHAVDTHNLNQPVPIEGGKELQELGESFNALLARVRKGFERQRAVIEDMSHQLKTPLSVIRGELEIALKRERSPAEYREALASSLEETDRMVAIIEGLLRLARIDALSASPKPEKILVHKLLESCVEFVRPLADNHKLTIQLSCPDDLYCLADLELLRQALMNLLDNAIKYAFPETIIVVSACNASDGLTLQVDDEGIAVADTEMPQLFERFFRGAGGRELPGHGLGLAIVRSVAELHGGRVEAKRNGTRMEFRILGLPRPDTKQAPVLS